MSILQADRFYQNGNLIDVKGDVGLRHLLARLLLHPIYIILHREHILGDMPLTTITYLFCSMDTLL